MANRMTTAIYLKVGATVRSTLVSAIAVPPVEPTVWGGSTDDAVVADVPVGQRKVTITAREDWEDETGLCEFLADNEGTAVEIIYAANPQATTPAYFKVSAVATSPGQAIQLNQWGEFTISLPCTKPVRQAGAPV